MQAFPPPYCDAQSVDSTLRAYGYAVLSPATVAQWAQCDGALLPQLADSWNGMPDDAYLKDGGRYRKRRHSCYVVQSGAVRTVAHRAHWQPVQYNALHGGMQRWFEPVLPATNENPAWTQLLLALGRSSNALFGTGAEEAWYTETHQFRIDTTDGIGRPTPEGAHRDGVDLVAVFLVGRTNIKGGETRVFDATGPQGLRFTLTEPWSLMLLDDARMIHESTPIQPLDESGGYRDTLVVTLRRRAFQGDDA
ncbi:2OG-Fe dioxygenase family protein [Comamonas odontotermitis]|uniref:2OG-Fe dioxygenase family protein n=1 Tax=Comamonas odontotermitis TaxID=379895 RepID=UPI0037535C9B